ncbi:MAG: hypothetical protein JWP66_1897 [Naasia sp.]|nr:hypothetical protein [Naasia sp.]
MKKHLGIAGLVALGLTALVATPAHAATGTLHVPDDFSSAYSATRANGHYAVSGSSLRVWTDGSSDTGVNPATGATWNTDKAAEYVENVVALEQLPEPSFVWRDKPGDAITGAPGYQVIVDFNEDGVKDGILVWENVYGGNWWLADAPSITAAAVPHTGGGNGSGFYGTWAEWQEIGGDALGFGFSLGSGVYGDGFIDSISYDGATYTFAEGPKPVVLANKNECKDGGWKTSTAPVFKNQGDCVSSFASAKKGK